MLEMTTEVVIEDVYVAPDEDPTEELIGIPLGLIIGIVLGACAVIALVSFTIYSKRKGRVQNEEKVVELSN